MKRLSLALCVISTLFLFTSISAQSVKTELEHSVTSYSNAEDLEKFEDADLDSRYPNLLDPKNQDKNADQIMTAWRDIHQQVMNILRDEGFDWNTESSQIHMVHKIYFKANGTVDHYFFRILNDSVSKEKRAKLKQILEDHIDELKIGLTQSAPFAQCGKTAYPNTAI